MKQAEAYWNPKKMAWMLYRSLVFQMVMGRRFDDDLCL